VPAADHCDDLFARRTSGVTERQCPGRQAYLRKAGGGRAGHPGAGVGRCTCNRLQAPPGWASSSITHRISGVIIFVAIAFLLSWFDEATSSPAGFAAVAESGMVKFLLWLILCAVSYHFFAGIKHLLLDFHIADTVEAGEMASKISVGSAAVVALLLGIWIW